MWAVKLKADFKFVPRIFCIDANAAMSLIDNMHREGWMLEAADNGNSWTVGWKRQASAASSRSNHSRQRWRCHFPSVEGAKSGHTSQRRGVSAAGQDSVRASSRELCPRHS